MQSDFIYPMFTKFSTNLISIPNTSDAANRVILPGIGILDGIENSVYRDTLQIYRVTRYRNLKE